jgi:CheY-like chemotaxis protein
MPEEDGYALIRAIRKLPENEGGRVPAIALTAYTRTEDRIRAIAEGFQMHIAKPADAVELLTMVESVARASKS